MNLFGWDVQQLDVDVFLASAHRAFLGGSLLWLALLVRVRRPLWLLTGVLLGNAHAWLVANWPLQRIYAMVASDRLNNIGFCQMVAAGNPFWQTPQVGQLHFEPFWGVLVAVLSGFDPDRVLAIYPFLPLLTVAGYVLTLYVGLAAPDSRGRWSTWERATIVGFATLLCAVPMDSVNLYRTAWAGMFLLKPNHALGLVLFPLFLRAFVGIRGWRARLAAGFLLHVLAWAFVMHMAFVAAGLVVFAAWSWLAGHQDRRRDVLDVVGVIGVNLAIVSPYLVMLIVGYPFLQSNPAATIPLESAHILELAGRGAPLMALALWGIAVARRRGDRLGRLVAAQVVGAWLIWVGYHALSLLQLARERDEAFFWARFLTAIGAGIGAWDVAGGVWRLFTQRSPEPAPRAAALALVALPWCFPYWWNPAEMDPYFQGCRRPVLPSLVALGEFLRQKTEPDAVVAGDHGLAPWIAALGARRVLFSDGLHLPKDTLARREAERALFEGGEPERMTSAAAHYRVRYLAVAGSQRAQGRGSRAHEKNSRTTNPAIALEPLRARAELEEVLYREDDDGAFVALFRLKVGSSR